jgi:hyperosmotically inducible periplasmic protein
VIAISNLRPLRVFGFSIAALVLFAVSVCTIAEPRKQPRPEAVDLTKEVRRRLTMLPNNSVFDNLTANVEGGKVVLAGQVVHSKLKTDAEAAATKVQGVTRVQNDVRILPALSSDDHVRKAAYRAIYGDPGLSRYRYSDRPLIHIIVEKGELSLEGVAFDASDITLAETRAKSVPNVSSLKNNLSILGPPAP